MDYRIEVVVYYKKEFEKSKIGIYPIGKDGFIHLLEGIDFKKIVRMRRNWRHAKRTERRFLRKYMNQICEVKLFFRDKEISWVSCYAEMKKEIVTRKSNHYFLLRSRNDKINNY